MYPHKKKSLLKPDTLFKIPGGEVWRPHAEGSRGGKVGGSINPLSPKSDQHQISPCNSNAL